MKEQRRIGLSHKSRQKKFLSRMIEFEAFGASNLKNENQEGF